MKKYRITNWNRVEEVLTHYYGSVNEGLSEYGISYSVKDGDHELSFMDVMQLQEATDCKAKYEEIFEI